MSADTQTLSSHSQAQSQSQPRPRSSHSSHSRSNSHNHTTTSSSSAVAPPPPPTRPVKKRLSSGGRVPRLQPLTQKSPGKDHAPPRRMRKTAASARESEHEHVGEDSMTFLQYCATCEKQIGPNGSLYCSDTCRDRDLNHSHPYRLFQNDDRTPLSASPPSSRRQSLYDLPMRDIVPQMSPTIPGHTPSTYKSYPYSYSDRSESVSASDSDTASISSQHEHPPSLSVSAKSSGTANRPYTPTSSSTLPSGTPSTSTSTRDRPRYNRWGSSFAAHSIDLVTPVTTTYSASAAHYPTSPQTHSGTSSSFATITSLSKTLSPELRHHSISTSYNMSPSHQQHDGLHEPYDVDTITYAKSSVPSAMDSSSGRPGSRSSLKTMFMFDEMRAGPAGRRPKTAGRQ